MSFSVSKILRKALSHVRHGEVKEAEILYKQILSEFPKNRQAILGYQRLKAGIDKKYLANSKPPDKQLQELLKLFNANRWEDVLQKVRPLIGLFPKSTSLRNLQGASYAALQNYDAAIKSYDKAIEADPFFADAHLNKGSALQETGELDAAIVSFNHTLVINPQHSSAFFNLGNALMAKGELDLAIDGYKNALKLDPQNAEAYCYMGNAFKEKGQLDEALDCYGNALTIRPNYADVHLNMGTAYDKKGDIDAAISSFQQTLKINPKYAMAYFNMGKVHETQGELTAAINYYKQAVKEQPDFAMAISNLIYAINLNGQPEGHVRFSQLRAHVQGLEAPFASNHYCLNNSRDPERTLNIGFVSADFQEHPIATYCLQLFASLSKYPNLTLHAYYNNDVEDTITTEIKKYFYNWSAVKRISDHKLTEKIIEDEIDILIDLSNHTAGNRLSVFARKPVPLQVTALGLPYTTALKAMDYYFTNQIAPRDKAHFSECFLEIPSITAYAPLFDPPDVNDLKT
ncbi:MAG: tetratricopeptide repeat protein [Paracoccaceae bacterium]|nr:tetratricopeptide repeat protein [Paracoccaceae bacterium]